MANTGKTFNDLKLAADVRTKVLKDIEKVLDEGTPPKEWSEYKKQLILTLSKNILPKLNEHTGQDGNPIEITGVEITVRR